MKAEVGALRELQGAVARTPDGSPDRLEALVILGDGTAKLADDIAAACVPDYLTPEQGALLRQAYADKAAPQRDEAVAAWEQALKLAETLGVSSGELAGRARAGIERLDPHTFADPLPMNAPDASLDGPLTTKGAAAKAEDPFADLARRADRLAADLAKNRRCLSNDEVALIEPTIDQARGIIAAREAEGVRDIGTFLGGAEAMLEAAKLQCDTSTGMPGAPGISGDLAQKLDQLAFDLHRAAACLSLDEARSLQASIAQVREFGAADTARANASVDAMRATVDAALARCSP
jgi:hypothetical protein